MEDTGKTTKAEQLHLARELHEEAVRLENNVIAANESHVSKDQARLTRLTTELLVRICEGAKDG